VHIEGVLVQKQIKGLECLLGISRDEQIVPTLVMRLGGVFVEILADVQIRIPPMSTAGARRALEPLIGPHRNVFRNPIEQPGRNSNLSCAWRAGRECAVDLT
jgi:ATP-grasp domain-containing protein